MKRPLKPSCPAKARGLVIALSLLTASAGANAFNETPPNEPSTQVSLKDAVRSAIEKTETAHIGEARVEQADARVDQAFSRFLPTLSAGGSFQQQDTGGTLSRQSSALFGGRQSYARLTLTQSVYAGGRDYSLLNAAKADKESQRQNLSVANYNTFSTVARGFYAILSGEREVENIKAILALANARVKEIEGRTRIGKARNVDLLAAQAQVSVLQAQLMAAENQLVTAWDQFVLITGLPRTVQLIKKRETPEKPKPLNDYLDLMEKRPDIASMRAQVDRARSDISAARSGHLPSVDVSGNYYMSRTGTQQGNDWDVGATLVFPLFTGGLVKAQVREASEREKENELLLNQTRRQAEISVRTAYNQLNAALDQIRVLESALDSTEKNYKEQERNYRFGQSNNLDVIQALNTYQDTKRTLDRTRYLALSAWADLKAATAQVSLAEVKGDS